MNIDIDKTNTLMHDKRFRQALMSDVNVQAPKLGFIKDEGAEFKVVKNKKNTSYFVILHNSPDVSEAGLANINAAGAFTVSTAGSLGSICSTASTLGTAGTALVVNGKSY